ncbi:alkylated DNA repair protein alkB homolog 8 isoform X2 [Belonocnema kinseyi]|uniref:alkylated DNA repair protein alkB homolog 8 isoform X2 n=1 Tax=Belonocnema kinseyi TaxID=2817044 RepID=UPI00143D0047|nr:alkylated DNA repair protein alkB homolog 8 isoform X2 [Belonocnema kinseyi]
MFESNMQCKNSKIEKKCSRKQKRAQHRLARDFNISCSETPTRYVLICNAGLVTGLSEETLKQTLDPVVSKYYLVMPPGKSYSFVEFFNETDAKRVYDEIHGHVKLPREKTPLYLSFTTSVTGLRLIENFLTDDQEKLLLENIDWEEDDDLSSELKHRKVKHFGYKFRYDTNTVDVDDPVAPIPENYRFLQNLFKEQGCGRYEYDQITINRYLPGQGIPPHIDTHSIFEDTILSLSLGSACVMDFKRGEEKLSLLLPSRSILVMSGECRYSWSHGICPRRSDTTRTENGTTVLKRGIRTSFTFRKIRRGDCECHYPEFCDSMKNKVTISESNASGLENLYVHEVYEQISDHFDQTRHKPWPNVKKFLDTIRFGGILLDVGCGNGKYLLGRPEMFKIGCDRSSGLVKISRKRGIETLMSDCLSLPYKDNCFDAAISIAVIHHLSTQERRRRAISEILRILTPGGRCLIYVWAKEQTKDSVESTYLKSNCKTQGIREKGEKELFGVTLTIHENRTEFTHSDNLVPWKRKGGGTFLRFYHVFKNGELEELCSDLPADIEKSYYDQGNWCVILQKINR